MFINGKWIPAQNGGVFDVFNNTGQACISPNRIFVHEDLLAPFTDELLARVSRMKAGSGFDAGVRIGPLVSESELDKVHRQVEDAVAPKGQSLSPEDAGCSKTGSSAASSMPRLFSAASLPA